MEPLDGKELVKEGDLDSFVTVDDFERLAHRKLTKNALGYYASGADDQITLRWNRSSFARLELWPFALRRDVTEVQTATSYLGGRVTSRLPIGFAPTAMQRMAHDDGEKATARAAEQNDVVMMLSTIATTSVEDVRRAAPNAKIWLQLYVYADRSLALDLIRRAEKCGVTALVLTVDAPVLGKRVMDHRQKFQLPDHLQLAQYAHLMPEVEKSGSSSIGDYIATKFDKSLTWSSIAWLKSVTQLPIIVKGVLRADDAVKAIETGCAGIVVSNHGARQVDTCPATIEALPEVVRAVNGRIDVYVDGGFRRGSDVLKALALGAKGVFVGRPVIWGLSCGGKDGVNRVLNILEDELKLNMRMCGVDDVQSIPVSLVRPRNSSNL